MAQTTRSSSKSSGSRAKRSNSRNGSSAKTRSRSTASRPRRSAQNGPVAKNGGKVAELASKAKGPLLAGGAAIAGIAGGAALKSRTQNRRPIDKLKSVSMPKVDLDALTSAARTVRSIGEQVGDVADAADKTRKKHK
jgi:hypothetical protein